MFPLPDHAPLLRPGEMVARRPVSELYDEPPRPPYDEWGVFVLDLVPHGELGKYVFFEDDPEYAYAVPCGSLVIKHTERSLARIARFGAMA